MRCVSRWESWPGAHMLENKIVDADGKIAERLGIETGSKVIFISL